MHACVCACVSAFMLYALNFDNMYMQRMCKHLMGPVWVRHSKYPLLLLKSNCQLFRFNEEFVLLLQF